MIGRWHGLIIDCPDPSGLAALYEQLLGMQRIQDDESRVVIGDAPGRPGLAFQLAPDYQPPRWPDHPQQMHLDVRVNDLDASEQQVQALGAHRLPGGGETFRVFGDPAGHPFCLVSF
jgi:hypothetical protein